MTTYWLFCFCFVPIQNNQSHQSNEKKKKKKKKKGEKKSMQPKIKRKMPTQREFLKRKHKKDRWA
jgi:hypothetical protein